MLKTVCLYGSLALAVLSLVFCVHLSDQNRNLKALYQQDMKELRQRSDQFGAVVQENMTKLTVDQMEMKEKVAIFESWTRFPTDNARVRIEDRPVLYFNLRTIPRLAINEGEK